MEIPENWQEELMLHDWKMMRIERCKRALGPQSWYHFPNGIRFRISRIEVDFEKANAVMAALSDLEPKKKKVNKGIATIQLNWDHLESMTKGELEDFKWRIYSLDV